MIGILDLASYIPPDFSDNSVRLAEFDKSLDFLDQKIGSRTVSRMAAGMETSDMCLNALELLTSKSSINISDVDCIVVCTQNPDGHGIPHTSAIVQAKIGAPSTCASFDISLGCSGYVYGLSIMKSFMEANQLKNGLLFTSDPYSKILDPNDPNTVLLFGDAGTVTYLGEANTEATELIPESFQFYTQGTSSDALTNASGKLKMNGMAVLRFAATTVPVQIETLLSKSNRTKEEIDLFIFHQGSKHILENLRKTLELPDNKVPIAISGHGNTVSSAIPLILENYLHESNYHRILLCGFGVGLSVASCVLTRSRL